MTKIKPVETSALKGLRKTTDGHKRIACHLLTKNMKVKNSLAIAKYFSFMPTTHFMLMPPNIL